MKIVIWVITLVGLYLSNGTMLAWYIVAIHAGCLAPVSILQKLGVYASRDFVYILFTQVITAVLLDEYSPRKAKYSNPLATAPLWFIASMLGWWLLSSLVDPILARHKSRLAYPTRRKRVSADEFKDLKIGMTLSGGGYRAALMHAGVLEAAENLGVLVTNISSVSGGSIIGAYYAVGGVPSEFLKAVKSGRLDLKRALFRVQNVMKLFMKRSSAQADLLDKVFFDGMTVDQLMAPSGPDILFCATDLKTGCAVGLTPTFGVLDSPLRTQEKYSFDNANNISSRASNYFMLPPEYFRVCKVSTLVAASGAFPLAFDAVRINAKSLSWPVPGLLLADGGISDNTGLRMLLETHRGSNHVHWTQMFPMGKPPALNTWNLDIVVSSDAGAIFQESGAQSNVFSTIFKPIKEFSRAMDIVYCNVAGRNTVVGHDIPRTLLISPEIVVKDFINHWRLPGVSDVIDPISIFSKYINQEYITYLVDELPDRQALHSLIAESLNAEHLGDELRTPKKLGRRLLEQLPPPSEGSLSWLFNNSPSKHDLIRVLLYDLVVCLDTFLATSTLQGSFSEGNAEQVFRLGKYLFFMGWDELKGSLIFLQQERDFQLSIWEELLRASKVTLTVPEQAMFSCEYGLYELYSPFNASTVRKSVSEWGRIEIPEKRNLIAALLAHRIARLILERENHTYNLLPRVSLLRLITSDLDKFKPEEEAIFLPRMIELLHNAGFSRDGGVSVLHLVKERLGSNHVSSTYNVILQAIQKYVHIPPG